MTTGNVLTYGAVVAASVVVAVVVDGVGKCHTGDIKAAFGSS